MFMRRLLALLCSLFLIFCVAWPGAYAVEIPNIDDLGIDPWGDLWLIQQTPSPSPDPDPVPELTDPDDEQLAGAWVVDGDYGIMPMSLEAAPTVSRNYKLTATIAGTKVVYSSPPVSISPNSSYSTTDDALSVKVTGNIDDVTMSQIVSYAKENYEKAVLSLRLNSRFYFNQLQATGTWKKNNTTSQGTLVYKLSKTYEYLPRSVQLLVNGQEYGDPIPWNSKTYESDVFSWEILFDDVGDSITSLGYFLDYGYAVSVSDTATWTGTGTILSASWHSNPFLYQTHGVVDPSIDFVQGSTIGDGDKVTHGLLGTIIEWIKTIATGIIELPGKIVTGLLDGLKGLFVPSEEDLQGLKDKYQDLLSERLGFVWQAGEMVISFGQSVLSAFESGQDFQFQFPGISFELPELGQVTLIQPQVVSVDNAFMDVMQPVLGTIVSFICVLAFINTAERMVVAVVSGVSYFHFLKGD